jgi:hypothetical protein
MCGGGEVKRNGGGTWVVGKKGKKKKLINNVMIKIKFKNQNYVLKTFFFFLNCDFSCETKTMYQT